MPSQSQSLLTGSGISGIHPEPPDTSFDEWEAGVEALLAEVEARQAVREERGRDSS